jgi:DNA polymerase elongation subunit (family B)
MSSKPTTDKKVVRKVVKKVPKKVVKKVVKKVKKVKMVSVPIEDKEDVKIVANTEASNATSQQKTKKTVTEYNIRLLDFNIYDNANKDDSDSDDEISDESGEYVPHKYSKCFTVQMFGIDEKGKTYSIIVDDFQPFFYIEIPEEWKKDSVHSVIDCIVHKLGTSGKYYKDGILKKKCTVIQRKKLYGFDAGKKYNFMKLVFASTEVMNKVKNLWYEQVKNKYGKMERRFLEDGLKYNDKTFLKQYEANIPPLLRLFHIQNISPSGWISLKKEHCNLIAKSSRKTYCDVEMEVKSFRNLKPELEKETAVPYKICSYDIEASSSHGDFPVPVKTYKRLTTNILDYWLNNITNEDIELEKPDVYELLKDCMICAFRNCIKDDDKEDYQVLLDEIDPELLNDIDEVYTVRKVRLAALLKSIERSLSIKMNRIRFQEDQTTESDDESDNGECGNKSQLKKLYQQKINELFKEHNDEDDGNIDITYQKLDKNRTIVDVLADDDVARENKLILITKAMDAYLPMLEGDKVTFIGSTFMKYGDQEPYMNHCIALNTCSPVKDAVIEEYMTEKEVLEAWTELIQRENPDIIIGYNIFGFDYSFMFKRATSYGQDFVKKFLKLSRNKKEICGKRPYDWETRTSGHEFEIEKSSITIASGTHDLEFIKMNGRIQIDLYNYFRREYNLTSYKLDYVSGHFIGDKIKDFEYNDDDTQTIIYSKNLMGLKPGHYIHIEEIGHSSEYYDDGAKFQVIDCNVGQFTINKAITPDRTKTLKWCLAKDDVTPQDIFRMTNEGPNERAVIAKYCIQDCNLVHNLLNKIDVITGFVEMANIVSVPIDFLIMRGQGIKLFSFVAKKCMEDKTLIPVLAKKNDGGYEGAIVLEPKCGLYLDEPVACVDYSSLYPSSMISENLSHDSKVWTREYNNNGEMIEETGEKNDKGEFIYDNLPDYKYVNVEYDTFQSIRKHPKAAPIKTKVGTKICRFAQFPDGQLGILPRILKTLLAARKATRASAKWKTVKTNIGDYTGMIIEDTEHHLTMKDKKGDIKIIEKESIVAKDDTFNDFMKNVLDKRQLAIKVTANSLYGQCGARTSSFYEKDVAASTTATGRKLLTYGKRIIEEVYGDRICETPYGKVHSHAEYVYGDTDSVFMSFKLTDPETGEKIVGKEALKHTIELAKEAGELATKFLKAPHDLEYEKTFMPFCLLSKKRYVGMLYEEDPDKCYRKSMGIVLKRRDNAPIVKDVYGGIIDILMKDQDVVKAIDFTKKCMDDIIDEKFPLEKLIITKSLRSFYKKPQQIAHKVLADRIAKRDPGNKPSSGDRVPFVYIQTKGKVKLQGDKVEHPNYIREHKLKPDFNHYITNQIMKPVQQVFGLVLDSLPNSMYSFAKKRALKAECRSLTRKYKHDDKVCRKKIETVCNKEVKALVFDEALRKCMHKKNGQMTLTNMFKRM